MSEWEVRLSELPTTSGRTRWITTAVPRSSGVDEQRVVFCTDGQVVESFVSAWNRADPESPPPVLIGVHNDPAVRAEEYLPSEHSLFGAHQRFFVEELPGWAEAMLDDSVERERSVVCGFSNGGAFALDTALRYPESFGAVIAMSVPPTATALDFSSLGARRPAIFLSAGRRGPEKSIRKNVVRLERTLRRRGYPVRCSLGEGEHELDSWATEFVAAITWLSDRSGSAHPRD